MKEIRWRVSQTLRRWGDCDRRRAEIRRSIAQLRDEINDVLELCSPAMSGMPGSGTPSDQTQQKALKLMDIEKRYEDRISQADQELTRIFAFETAVEEALAHMPVAEYETVIRLRYRKCYSYEKIAWKMEKSVDWVKTLHGRALDELSKEKFFQIYKPTTL